MQMELINLEDEVNALHCNNSRYTLMKATDFADCGSSIKESGFTNPAAD